MNFFSIDASLYYFAVLVFVLAVTLLKLVQIDYNFYTQSEQAKFNRHKIIKQV